MRKSLVVVLGMLVSASLGIPVFAGDALAKRGKKEKARNIIFMVPDGMGVSYVTAARIFRNGPDGARLAMETLPQIGYQRTHSANSTVTDSAAAASAWASGEKFNNGVISCHDSGTGICVDPVPTILELAAEKKKATGLVVTSNVSHATPGAFGAHAHHRNCEEDIASQYIAETGVDVVLGGGIAPNRPPCKWITPDPGDGDGNGTRDYVEGIIRTAGDNGYTVVRNRTELDEAVEDGADKVLGLFDGGDGEGAKSWEGFRFDSELWPYPVGEPTLAQMTASALDILQENKKGFFLMVEGSQIDWAGHDNDSTYLIAETLGFDAAVGEVIDWISAKKKRSKETLVIIVADHETGGFMINGPHNRLSELGTTHTGSADIVTGWTSSSHTAQDTMIWSRGPGSENLGKALDNSDLYYIMAEALR